MCLSCEQFRKLVCNYLAAVLCVKGACSSNKYRVQNDAVELDSPTCNHVASSEGSNHQLTGSSEVDEAVPIGSRMERLLAEIRDLLDTKVRTKVRRRHEKEKNEQLMNEWVVAAKVIDRICFILLIILFVGGTLAFILFLFLPGSRNDRHFYSLAS